MDFGLNILVDVISKIRTPLALAGLVVVGLYVIYRHVLSLNIFSKVGKNATVILIGGILNKIFWLAMVALILGIASYIFSLIIQTESKRNASVELIDVIKKPIIKINDISDLPFPTVDFKLINRGNATAVLWKLDVVIESIEVDPTPVISFSSGIETNDLILMATNNGWGLAESLSLQIVEPLLERLFSKRHDSRAVRVESGQSQEACRFSLSSASDSGLQYLDGIIEDRRRLLATLPDRMREGDKSILNEKSFNLTLCSHERWHVREYFDDLDRGDQPISSRQQWHIDYIAGISREAAPINDIDVRSTFYDVHGRVLEHEQKIRFGAGVHVEGQIWLSRSGFVKEWYSPPVYSLMLPTINYIVMLDYQAGRVERSYRASLAIPSGEPERFLITVGADRSCSVKAKFVFYLDGGDTICSDPFELQIWCPRDMRVHAIDGSQLVATDDGWELANQEGVVTSKPIIE